MLKHECRLLRRRSAFSILGRVRDIGPVSLGRRRFRHLSETADNGQLAALAANGQAHCPRFRLVGETPKAASPTRCRKRVPENLDA